MTMYELFKRNEEQIAMHVKLASEFWPTFRRELIEPHKVPFCVVLYLAFCIKYFLPGACLWALMVLCKRPLIYAFERLPVSTQTQMRSLVPARIKSQQSQKWLQEINEGIDQCAPFVFLAAFFSSCIFIAFVCMAKSWLRRVRNIPLDTTADFVAEPDRLDFVQNKAVPDKEEEEENFLHSPMFAVATLCLFLSGIPAILAYLAFNQIGLGPYFHATSIMGLFKDPVFLEYLYIPSVGSAVASLFIRAWFTFPLNFLHDQYRLELTRQGIRRHSKQAWFLYAITLNRPGQGPDSLVWDDVHSVRFAREGCTQLHPLPDNLLSRHSLIYKVLNRFAAFIDSLSNKITSGEYIVVSTGSPEGQLETGRAITINVHELSQVQRAQLFHFIQQSAPQVAFTKKASEMLIGADVTGDPRYTQIWFDLLTADTKPCANTHLQVGQSLTSSASTWTIVEPLLSGGQANTYIATGTTAGVQDQQTCVLKEFILSQADSTGALIQSATEFEAEATTLSQLSHKHIVRLLDFFAANGRVYIALEHLSGQSLKQLVQERGPLSQNEVKELALQLCDVLAYLHNQTPAVVHRDVTPENIIVMPDGQIKLIDFGLSVRQAQKSRTTSVGKHCYTPPEQFREVAATQSDIYALGATMYFCLTGKQPRPLSQSSPASVNPEIDEHLSKIIERATSQDLHARYEQVEWLQLELEQLGELATGFTIKLDDEICENIAEKIPEVA